MKTRFTFASWNQNIVFLLLLTVPVLQARAQTSHTVDVTSNVFTPNQLTLASGDTVIWTNSEGFHNVNGTQATYPSNPESFGNETGTGWTYSHVFTIPGTYDYHCNPHVGLGMVGQLVVESSTSNMLTINFTGMTPHVGQTLWLVVEDRDESMEILRISREIEEAFSVEVPGILVGNDYRVEFFADHNGNGYYDVPPTDHAWRYDLDAVSENEVLDFAHNTDFTDVMWKHRLRVKFSGMNPHLGQKLTLYVRDLASESYLDTVVVETIQDSEFDVESHVVEPGNSYLVEFYADHNGNGTYDAPPTDHAWRLETGESSGDLELEFAHNTNFTDIFGPSTGVKNSRYESDGISLYPNPAHSYVYIESELEITSIDLYDIKGSKVKNLNDLQSPLVYLTLEGVQPGVYFIKVTSADHQSKISRMVKQ